MKKVLMTVKVFVIIQLLSLYATAEPASVNLDLKTEYYNLGKVVDILEDKTGTLTIDDLSGKNYTERFTKSDHEVPKFGYTTSAFWLRIKIVNSGMKYRDMYFEIGYPHLDSIELYTSDNKGNYSVTKAGFKYPFDQRIIKHRNFIFKLNLKEGDNLCFIRIQSSSSVKFPVSLQTPEHFLKSSINEYIILGLYYGILLVMILYNFFVYLSVKDISYLYYIVYIFSFMLFSLSLNGLAFQFLWPDSIGLSKISTPFFIFLGIITIGQFIRKFLDLKKLAPVAEMMVVIMMLLCVTGIIITVFFEYSFATRLAAITTNVAVINYLIVGIISVVKGNRTARFYLAAWTLFLIGCSLLGLQYAGYLPSNFITQYGVQIGSAAEVVLLSFALGDKINILQLEKENAQQRTIQIQRNATETLERKVAERTLELNRANEHLKELDKIKSNFFANISHEIRTPLTLILSPIESLLQGDIGENADRKFFENLQRNAIRLLKLINNLLDFSKLEAGRMDLKINEVDIVKLVRNYTSSVHSAAELKGITMTFVSMKSELPLFIDMEKFDKIVMNLFSNSLKFTDPGGTIKISVRDDEKYCYIDFEDSGIGIPADKLGSIFDRFSQVDSESTRKYEGTGIGLALVKELIEIHGGEISVESRFINLYRDDHGTRFTVKLPKGTVHFKGIKNLNIIKNNELEESISDYKFFGIRNMVDLKEETGTDFAGDVAECNDGADILIVEDNRDMQNFLKFLLHKYYNVHIAENGEEGYEKTLKLMPSLIITDVMMPLMNGYEMTRKLKENNNLRRIPVIMLTAKSDITSKIEGIEFGADDYLTKPFNSKELLTRVRMLLKTREYEIAIEKRNREIEQDLKIARLIQNRLLPNDIPRISGFRFHSTYIPMDKVGGDFYDFKESEKYIEILISDVSGHGLVSAFISLITKMAFDSIYTRTSCTHVLYQLNDILCNSMVNSNYVTTFYCLIERDTKKMKFSNAGHIYPVVYRKSSDEFFELKAKGKPLGCFTDIELHEGEIDLAEGDRVVLYTDGVTECMSSDKRLFGDNRFREIIKDSISLPPEKFSEKLIDDLRTFCDNKMFNDDLCLLIFDVLDR